MSDFSQFVENLERKINKLLQKHIALTDANIRLQSEIKAKEAQIKNLQISLSEFESKYQTLKIANTMLGSDTNKRETKLKINALIRDIDHCISQLSK